MSYISHSQIVEFMDQSYWVNAKGSGLHTQPLKRMLSQVEAMLSHHNKVFLLRFDLHQPEYTDTSAHISKFFKYFSESIKRQYNLTRIGFVWAREQEKAKQQHYHCFILVDGNKVKASHKLIEAAQWYWEVIHDGSLAWPEGRCYYRLTRDDNDTLQDAIYHISYLAKGRGKGYKPIQAKNFGGSRINIKRSKTLASK